MNNSFNGDCVISFNGENAIIRYDYEALQSITDAFDGIEIESLLSGDISVMAERIPVLLSIGLRKHHPDIDAQKVKEVSPPFTPTINAISRALHYSFTGEDLNVEETDVSTTETPAKKNKH
ncbi:MAG: hypothetical protein KAS87_05880 [Candidatus Omnitrophica bacterium]|nr:hypothetical protein [Candidatus Omnitrophota bacterium]